MLSLDVFRNKCVENISVETLGKFTGGYDLTVYTTPAENPYLAPQTEFGDRMHYDYCFDTAGNRINDYRGGFYAIPID